MSMTREELRQWFAEWLEDYYDELHSEDDLTPEVAESVLTALRPVSREQIEKAWRSFWEQGDIYDFGDVCQKCGYDSGNEPCRMSFCPACGAPMTDEAVQMVMERLEALHSETKTD